jgi:hypothetical protein
LLKEGATGGCVRAWVREGDGGLYRLVRLRIHVHAHEQMRARVFVTSERCLRFVFAGLCTSRVGAAEPVRTEAAPLEGSRSMTCERPTGTLSTNLIAPVLPCWARSCVCVRACGSLTGASYIHLSVRPPSCVCLCMRACLLACVLACCVRAEGRM